MLELQETASKNIQEHLGALLAAFLFWLIVTYLAKKKDFFKFPLPSNESISFSVMLGGFLVYLAASLLIVPLFLAVTGYILDGSVQIKKLYQKNWVPTVSLGIIFICIAIYALSISKKTLKLVLWGKKIPSAKEFFKGLGWGILTWGISYPTVIFANLLGGIFSLLIWGKSGIHQTAVQYLMNTFQNPLLFTATFIFLITIVPITEEFLFRGLFQSWLKKYCGRIGAILLTAVFFAFMHFSPSQGMGNLELVISLFSLACFLGFIYERQQTLWAPIGLHMTFNAFNILMLTVTHAH